MLSATYVPLDSRLGDADDAKGFYASIAAMEMGEVALSRVQTTAASVRRTRQHLGQLHEECLLVHCARSGRAQIEQRGRMVAIQPGDITVYLSTEPYGLSFQQWSETRVLKIPITAMQAHVRNLHDLTAQVISRTSVEASMLTAMVSSLWSGASRLHGSSASTVAQALIQVTAAAMQLAAGGPGPAASNLEAYYITMAKREVRKHLRSPHLTPDAVAAALGISVRHLARIFESQPYSVARLIWVERLEGCQRALAAAGANAPAIAPLAFAWGFNNASHFSKAFRQHFGLSPTAYWQSVQAQRALRGAVV